MFISFFIAFISFTITLVVSVISLVDEGVKRERRRKRKEKKEKLEKLKELKDIYNSLSTNQVESSSNTDTGIYSQQEEENVVSSGDNLITEVFGSGSIEGEVVETLISGITSEEEGNESGTQPEIETQVEVDTSNNVESSTEESVDSSTSTSNNVSLINERNVDGEPCEVDNGEGIIQDNECKVVGCNDDYIYYQPGNLCMLPVYSFGVG